MPDWIVVDEIGRGTEPDPPYRAALKARVRIRKWHPGFWVFFLRVLFDMLVKRANGRGA